MHKSYLSGSICMNSYHKGWGSSEQGSEECRTAYLKGCALQQYAILSVLDVLLPPWWSALPPAISIKLGS